MNENTHEIDEPISPQQERQRTIDQIRERIADETLFFHQKDRDIATGILDQLVSGIGYAELSGGETHVYDEAIEALDFLVPKRNDKGWRVIGDINISPGLEKLIASRTEAEEVDIMAESGSWGMLPQSVRQEIIKSAELILELSDRCTVKCSFCGLADKGLIKKKVSFNSAKAFISEFVDNQIVPEDVEKSDVLYWATDPFDVRWQDGDKDYTDIALYYWRQVKDKPRFMYTSTAIPIGEEFRILRFMVEFINRKQELIINGHNQFRVSRRNENMARAMAIMKIVTALYGKGVSTWFIDWSDNRSDNIVLAGSNWDRESLTITFQDIIGVNCRDGVIVGPDGVDGVVMEASSNERKIGEDRFPVKSEDSTGRVEYVIPHHQQKPDGSFDPIYPNTVVTRIWTDNHGRVKNEVKEIKSNPHRAFLRMIAIVARHCSNDSIDNWRLDRLTRKQKRQIRQEVGEKTVRLVKDYLIVGAENRPMRVYMEIFKSVGLF